MKTEIRIIADLSDEQLDVLIQEIKSTAEMMDIKLELESSELSQQQVSGSVLMNILEDNYELNKQFHEASREMIYSFATAHYNETLTFEAWLDKYYH